MQRKKKIIIRCILIMIATLIGFSTIAYLQFDISPTDYIKYSLPLTSEEEAYLKEKKTIVYGMDRKAPPLTFTNEETGQNEGLLIDYMMSLSIELGFNVSFAPLTFNEVMASLDEQRIDMSDLFESPERSRKYAVTQPLYKLRGIAITDSQREDLQDVSDLKNKRIALIEDDYAVEYFNRTYPEDLTKNTYVLVKDMMEALELLIDGEVDAAAGDETVIEYYLGKNNQKALVREIGDGLYEQNVTFAVRKEDTQLLSILNKGILRLKEKNILVQGQKKWFDSSAPVITDINAMRWLPFVIAVAIIILLAFFQWQSIMDRKIAARTKEIQLQKDSQRTIIDNIHVLLFVLDCERRIVDANHMAVETLKKTMKDKFELPIGKNIEEVPLLAALLEAEKNAEKCGEAHIFKGRYYTVFVRKLNAMQDNRLVVIEDWTEKILSERQLRQESKMSAVGQLSAGLAHEIRNPLGLIRNYTYILNYSVEASEDTSHALQIIEESTERINGLIENLLSFSRISDESLSLINIYELLQNIIALQKSKMEKYNIRIILDCSNEVRFYTGEEILKITLINLINNAIDALSEIERDDKWIKCRVRISNDEMYIDVIDNGSGIPEENVDSIFLPFFTTKDYGTGLGLYTVSSELENLGGKISLDSEYKAGAHFTVRLPKTEVEQGGEKQYE